MNTFTQHNINIEGVREKMSIHDIKPQSERFDAKRSNDAFLSEGWGG